jgi:hypothetical protein
MFFYSFLSIVSELHMNCNYNYNFTIDCKIFTIYLKVPVNDYKIYLTSLHKLKYLQLKLNSNSITISNRLQNYHNYPKFFQKSFMIAANG